MSERKPPILSIDQIEQFANREAVARYFQDLIDRGELIVADDPGNWPPIKEGPPVWSCKCGWYDMTKDITKPQTCESCGTHSKP